MALDPLITTYLADEESYESGDIIVEEGTRGDWIYVVLEGQVKVTKRTALGMLTIDILKKGAVFGELALFGVAGQTRSASVIAADGSVRVGVLDSQHLIEEYESLSGELRSVIKAVVMELKKANEKAAALVLAANQKKKA